MACISGEGYDLSLDRTQSPCRLLAGWYGKWRQGSNAPDRKSRVRRHDLLDRAGAEFLHQQRYYIPLAAGVSDKRLPWAAQLSGANNRHDPLPLGHFFTVLPPVYEASEASAHLRNLE